MLIIQALFTALLSGLFSSLILFGLNERRDRSEARLKKIEEAIEAHHAWYEAAQDYLDVHWDYGTTGNHAEAEKSRKAADVRLTATSAKAGMLRGIYLPGQQSAAVTIFKSLQGFSKASSAIRKASINKYPYQTELYDPISDARMSMLKSVPQAQEMYDVARGIVNRPLLLRRYQLLNLRWRAAK